MPTNRKFKTPEQLQIGDVIPAWGPDLVVEHVEFVEEQEGMPYQSAVVKFEGEKYCVYPTGSVVAVVDD